MIPEIGQHRDEIIAICEGYGLERLEAFGSATTVVIDPEQSEVDLLVDYPEGFAHVPWGSRVDELRERLERVLERKIDLVVLRWVDNPFVRRTIQQQRTLFYAR